MQIATPVTASAPETGHHGRPDLGRVLLVAVAFLFLLLLSSWVSAAISGRAIERELRGRAEVAVRDLPNPRGGTWEIEFDGRDGRVVGEVHEASLKEGIAERIRNLSGVRVLDDRGLVFRPMEEPWIQVAVRPKEKSLSVSGVLPTAGGWKTRVRKGLRGLDGPVAEPESAADADGGTDLTEWRLEDRIEERPDVFDPGWTEGIGPLVAVLAEHPRAEGLAIRDGRAALEGVVYTGEARDALSIAADAAFRSSGLVIDNRFRIVEAPRPPTLSLAWTPEGVVTLGGKVADEEAKQRIESAIAGSLPPVERFTSDLAVGDNTDEAPWEEAVGLLVPGLVSETKAGSLTVEDKRVRISGEMESEEMRESLQEMAAQSFPEGGGYQFDIALIVHVPPRPAIMSVIHMAEAGVKLKGVVGSEATRETFVALAREHLAEGMLLDTDQIEIEKNTMEPAWMSAFASILPGFIENTTRGGLTVYENTLVIEAEVPTELKRDVIWQLSGNFFPDPDFSRTLELKVVDPSLPPEEDLGPEDPDAFGMPE